MSRTAIREDILTLVVRDKGRTFATKDVSEDQRMRAAHPELIKHSHFHAFVGGALSDHRGALGINEIRKGTSRGSLWEKQGRAAMISASTPTTITSPTSAAGAAARLTHDLGPQYHGDSAFSARMRLHQSWYRARVLGLPCGTGPTSSATSHYGNMLTRDDGAAGRNFLTPEIAQLARNRVAQGRGTVEPFRLFHNMLSSQPMCFNLFGPLVGDRTLARRVVGTLVPEDVAEVTRVELEWAPEPADDYLGDRTAFDAFVEYRTRDDRLCAVGVETKLTEPFSQKEYDGERYRRWMRVADSPWRPDAGASVHAISHNQLWRDHLLAVAVRCHSRSPYSVARLLVVHHPQDHECAHVLDGYRRLLRTGDDSLLDVSLDHLVGLWRDVTGEAERAWLDEFNLRYLDLGKSEGAASQAR